MREFITADRIANKIRQMRSQHQGSFLIVEGDTDARLYKNLVDSTKCLVENANSKDKAVAALNILEKDNFAGVLAIVDADFWILEGTVPSSPSLLLTDTHDLETMLLQSPALEKVLSEHGSAEKIIKFSKNIRQNLLESGKQIGYLRWASLRFDFSLKFEDLAFNKFVDRETLAVDLAKLIQTIKAHSQKHSLLDKEIQNKLESLVDESHDIWYVCCGHDIICILSIGLCKALGSCNSKNVEPNILEKDLRLAYERSYFSKTKLYSKIQNWEQANQNYQVLAL